MREAPEPALIELGPVRHLERPRSDGYWPFTDLLWVRGRMFGVPGDESVADRLVDRLLAMVAAEAA